MKKILTFVLCAFIVNTHLISMDQTKKLVHLVHYDYNKENKDNLLKILKSNKQEYFEIFCDNNIEIKDIQDLFNLENDHISTLIAGEKTFDLSSLFPKDNSTDFDDKNEPEIQISEKFNKIINDTVGVYSKNLTKITILLPIPQVSVFPLDIIKNNNKWYISYKIDDFIND